MDIGSNHSLVSQVFHIVSSDFGTTVNWSSHLQNGSLALNQHSLRLRICSSRALSHLSALSHVGARCSDPGTHVLSFGFMSGFGHSRSTFCLYVGVCGLEFARPHALLSTCVLLCCTQFVFLSAACIHVISCAVWHAAFVFHWLCAFLLSCLVWTHGLWVFSLAVCSCLVLHMAGELFSAHVHVFLFCVSTWLLS